MDDVVIAVADPLAGGAGDGGDAALGGAFWWPMPMMPTIA